MDSGGQWVLLTNIYDPGSIKINAISLNDGHYNGPKNIYPGQTGYGYFSTYGGYKAGNTYNLYILWLQQGNEFSLELTETAINNPNINGLSVSYTFSHNHELSVVAEMSNPKVERVSVLAYGPNGAFPLDTGSGTQVMLNFTSSGTQTAYIQSSSLKLVAGYITFANGTVIAQVFSSNSKPV